MSLVRTLVAFVVVTLAVVVQVAVFPHVAWEGIVPNLALLTVVGAGLTRGAAFGATLGLAAGLLVDLAPPADHIAGRGALALVLVGYLAGLIRQGRPYRLGAAQVVLVVAACSFVGSSVFALTGLLLADPALAVSDLVTTILIALVWDVLLTPFVLTPVMLLFDRTRPVRVPA